MMTYQSSSGSDGAPVIGKLSRTSSYNATTLTAKEVKFAGLHLARGCVHLEGLGQHVHALIQVVVVCNGVHCVAG